MAATSNRRVRVFGTLALFCGLNGVLRANQDPAMTDTPILEAAPAYLMPGVGFSPYIDGQDPNLLTQIPLAQIQSRMKLVAAYTLWIRSFGMQYGLENIPSVARSLKKKVAAGAWLSRDSVQNAREIANLIAAARAGNVDIAIVGSEVLLRGDLSEAALLSFMAQVKQAVPPAVLVTTADTWAQLLAHPNVIAASDVIAANFYPYWERVPVSKAVCSLRAQYKRLVSASGGKPVIVSETGWPSDGNPQGAAIPSPVNAARFFLEFASWARANNVTYWYFEAFDESWKAAYEGAQGSHWGIWDKNGALKPGMAPVFAGQSATVDCTTCGSGTPSMTFTYIPPMGTVEWLEGRACHIDPTAVNVVVYINVAGNWWVKPYANAVLTRVSADGSWSSAYATGGIDETATQFIAFLIPDNYSPPVILGGPLPQALYQSSLAWIQAPRSNNSISGTILDTAGARIPDVTIALNGANVGSTTSAASGKYSFVNVSNSGSDGVTPTLQPWTFQPPNRILALNGGAAAADFTGTSSLDLLLAGSFVPSVALPQGTDTYTLTLTNTGPGRASNPRLMITLPSSITMTSASATRGSCSAGNPIVCDAGVLYPTQFATYTLQLRTGGLGRYVITSVATTPEPDTNPANNTLKQTLAVDHPPVLTSVAPAALTSARFAPATLSATYSDPDGAGDLGTVLLYAGDTASTGLRVRYVVATNTLSMLNDAGNAWLPGCAPGSPQTLSNSRGSLSCAATTVAFGPSIVVNWRLTATGISGTFKVSLSATDKQSVAATKALGTWTITP